VCVCVCGVCVYVWCVCVCVWCGVCVCVVWCGVCVCVCVCSTNTADDAVDYFTNVILQAMGLAVPRFSQKIHILSLGFLQIDLLYSEKELFVQTIKQK